MILTMWIAVRVTVVAIEGSPAEEMQRMASGSGAAPLAAPAPGPRNPAYPERHSARLATLAVPLMPRRGANSAARRAPQLATGDAVGRTEHLQAALGQRPEAERGAMLAEALSSEPMATSAGNPVPAGSRLSHLAAPTGIARPAAATAGTPRDRTGPRLPRWSADGWLLLRGGDQAPALSPGTAAYGGSQAGGVLRYGFAPASALRPQAYLRVSTALGAQVRQSEAALGLMVRPVRRLPVALLGEWRLQEQSGVTRSRPVVMAVTQMAPLRLPLGVEAEAYAQGGWAGGRDATPFYDLAATLQRHVIRPLPGTQLSAGGGVWSGGQRGAVRLDLGPRVELRTVLGPSSRRIGVRVGVDWRFRVAGRAEPGSGPALTVAAGF
ncbi:hypothetical protein [Novosphingobium sp.]|uniref:hypothetical protein n=1 Tax=Novosphingobium sp. TaxID=1874826 RepID=UPI00262E769C|nr:hypothetical protein [Novosphingobium sp.]